MKNVTLNKTQVYFLAATILLLLFLFFGFGYFFGRYEDVVTSGEIFQEIADVNSVRD